MRFGNLRKPVFQIYRRVPAYSFVIVLTVRTNKINLEYREDSQVKCKFIILINLVPGVAV